MNGGVLSQIRDLQSVIDGFQLDCETSKYTSEDMSGTLEDEAPSSPTRSQSLNHPISEMHEYILNEQSSDQDNGSQTSEDLDFKSCDDLDELLEAALEDANGDVMLLDDILNGASSAAKGVEKREIVSKQSMEQMNLSEEVGEGSPTSVSTEEILSMAERPEIETTVSEGKEALSCLALPSEEVNSISKEADTMMFPNLETATTPTDLSKDPFDNKLEFRISTDFSDLLNEFSFKEYPVSPVTIKKSYIQRETNESLEFSQEKLEDISKQKLEILKGTVWRRGISTDKTDRLVNEGVLAQTNSTIQQKNTRPHTSNTIVNRQHNKGFKTSSYADKNASTVTQPQLDSQIPKVTVTSEEEEAIWKRRGDIDHLPRSFEQMRRIDNNGDRVSLYDDYFRECINAKTDLIKWTKMMTNKGKPTPMTEGYEPPSRNADLSKSVLRSKSNLMVVTSSTSMNALRRSIMKIPKPNEPSRKSAGVGGPFSPSPNGDSWLDHLATPRIKERAKSFLNFRNLAPSRGFSTPNLRAISGASQGIFNGRNRQISPMGVPTPTGRSNRVVNFAKDESDAVFRLSKLPPTAGVACLTMQPNEGYYRQWQLPSKENQEKPKTEQMQHKKSALDISALLNQEPTIQNPSEAHKSTDSSMSISPREAYPHKPPSLQTNVPMTQSPTSASPSSMLTFHQYEPQAATEATVKRLPLRKRLTMETKVQLQQQSYQQQSNNPPSAISSSAQEAPAPSAPAPAVTVPPAVPSVPPPTNTEPALDSDTTETDEEKGSVEIYNPVVVQQPPTEASPPVVKMKPLKKAKVWGSTDSLQGHTTHQSTFVNMQSQFQITESSDTPPDTGVKRDIGDDASLPATKRPKQTNDLPPTPDSKGPASSSDELYCICRKPYDKPRFMIACDECDQWFHGECVGMSERDGGLIELYYCPACSRATGKQTSWKVKCANPACVKPARTAKSKHRGNKEVESRYCSGDCGLLLARARIANCDKKRRAALEDARAQKTQIIKVRSAADMDDRKLLVTLREEQNKLEEAIAQADQRSRFLKLVIRRQQEHKSDDPGVEEVKSLGMKMKRADEGGICGFDSRLLWDNEEPWSKCLQEEDDDDVAIKLIDNGDYRVCLNNRKCQRHAQWQKLKTAEIDLERSEDIQALKKLKKQRHQAKVRMKNRRENVTEIVNNGVIDHRVSSVVA